MNLIAMICGRASCQCRISDFQCRGIAIRATFVDSVLGIGVCWELKEQTCLSNWDLHLHFLGVVDSSVLDPVLGHEKSPLASNAGIS